MAGAGALATEVLIGLAIGSILRMFLNALNGASAQQGNMKWAKRQ